MLLNCFHASSSKTRIETEENISIPYIRWRVFTPLPAKQGLKLEKITADVNAIPPFSRLFQQNKDWNSYNQLKPFFVHMFSRLFQQNKDWNITNMRNIDEHKQGFHASSSKTRIETNILIICFPAVIWFSRLFQQNKDWNITVAFGIPIPADGFHASSSKTRIETSGMYNRVQVILRFSRLFQQNKDWNQWTKT